MSHDAPQPAVGEQPQVFVSYSRKDAETVEAITRLLEDAGVTVWRDTDQILGGQRWRNEIAHAIKHSRVLLLMGSSHSFESENVSIEVELTEGYRTPCLPIWISGPVEIPERLGYALAGLQWVEAHSGSPEQWLPRLIKALAAMGVDIERGSGKPREAAPAPVDRPSSEITRTSRRWLVAGALGIFALFGFVIYKANKNGIVMIAGTENPATRDEPGISTTVAGRIKLRLIPDGEFDMGSDERLGDPDEHPRHTVRITRAFYLGVCEITQAQYEAVTGEKPSCFCSKGDGKDQVAGASTDSHPVERVSWLDAVLFCNKLSEKEGLKPFYQIDGERVSVPTWGGEGYRLPTEAEWEYAAGGDPADLGKFAWYEVNSGHRTHAVAQLSSNRYGLYDMLGNAWEWCWDAHDESYYKRGPSEDPRGPTEALTRVYRGGGWSMNAHHVRVAHRHESVPGYRNDDLGFRVARGQSHR